MVFETCISALTCSKTGGNYLILERLYGRKSQLEGIYFIFFLISNNKIILM